MSIVNAELGSSAPAVFEDQRSTIELGPEARGQLAVAAPGFVDVASLSSHHLVNGFG
jgi:hypothetical protein